MIRATSLFLLFITVLWLIPLGYRDLFNTDEGRYAEIAREMHETREWITPRLNGLKYFEKPPLHYWASSTAFHWFGVNAWSARLWNVLLAILGVGVAGYTASRLFGTAAGKYTAWIAASSFFYLALAQINTLDMGLSFFMTLALCGFLLAQQNLATPPITRRWMAVAWAAMALATLSKGLVGIVLPGVILLAYMGLTRQWRILKRLHWIQGTVIFLAIAAPWFILVSQKNPEFPGFFFVHEHWNRFLTPSHNREEAWYYFLPILLLGLFPWTPFLLDSLKSAVRAQPEQRFQPQWVLALWILLIMLFFSVSRSKLPHYILPIFPALALLMGRCLAHLDDRTLNRRLWAVCALAWLFLIAALSVFGLIKTGNLRINTHAFYAGSLPNYLAAMSACALLLAIVTSLAPWIRTRYNRSAALLTIGIGALLSGEGLMLSQQILTQSKSDKQLAQQIQPWLTPQTTLYAIKTYAQSLPFYLGQTFTLVDYYDELAFGITQEPTRFIPDLTQFASRWASDAQPFALMRPHTYPLVAAKHLPMTTIHLNSDWVAIIKPQKRTIPSAN